MSELLYIKRGDFKSGFFSKLNAGEFHFYEDKIIFNTKGLSRIFNSAPIIIEKNSIFSYSEGFAVIGYLIRLKTQNGDYTLRFLGDKLEILRLFNNYTN
jgi:hypothetical protein